MKTLRFLLPMFFLLLTMFSCKGPKLVQVEIPSDHIEFGYINQKTSAFQAYIILKDGSFYQKNAIDSKSTLIKKIPERDAQFIYHTVSGLKAGNSTLYQLGEELMFVRIRQNNTLVQEWKWLKGNEDLPHDIQTMDRLFSDLMELKLR